MDQTERMTETESTVQYGYLGVIGAFDCQSLREQSLVLGQRPQWGQRVVATIL